LPRDGKNNRMPDLPIQVLQVIGPAGETSALFPDGRHRVILGDCLAVMRALSPALFDVLYLDPPFFTGKARHTSHDAPDAHPSYADTWPEGLQGYLAWLEARLAEMHRLLKPEGVLLVHLDWHAVHYAKVILDRLFGYDRFQNEFIWYYSGGGASRRRFARKHDTILFYTKGDRWKFYADRVREPYKWTDGQRRADGSARDYSRGKLPDDVWEHHALLPWADEALGYPTQKPVALLERLLRPLTDPGDVVGDFFSGSGTTAVAAQRLGCRWLTVDESRPAVCVTAERLAEVLAPGCLRLTGARARARARERYARIEADAARIGLAPDTHTACALTFIPGTGFQVEALATEDAPPGTRTIVPHLL
jgi:DNA modification methylase